MTNYGTIPKWFEEDRGGWGDWLQSSEARDILYQHSRDAGIERGKLGRMRFTSFEVDRDPQAYALSSAWLNAHLEGTHPPDGGWLFLQGKNGRGKTHLAVALLHLLTRAGPCMKANNRRSAGIYIPNSLYVPWAEATAGYEAWEEYRHQAETRPFLVIDDLTKRRVSPWSLEVLYEVVDRRDLDDRVTIFTSNTTLPDLFDWYQHQADNRDRGVVVQLALAIIGRIQQRIRSPEGSWLVSMTGTDYRTT